MLLVACHNKQAPALTINRRTLFMIEFMRAKQIEYQLMQI